MLNVHLPDGSVKEYDGSVSPGQVAASIGAGLAKASLAAVVDGKVVGLDYPLPESGDVKLRILTKKDAEALGVMRHSCAHIMARAVMRLFDGVQLAFGPTVEGGFYYDFQLPQPLTEADFPAIEAEMAKIIKLNEPFERVEESHDQALKICQDLGQHFKVEHINDGLKDHGELSFYRQGEFIDLCRGPHVPAAGAIGAYKLLSVAGAYWKGDQEREQLQRLYATAFFSKEDLESHLAMIEDEVVGRRKWLSRQRFLDLVGATHLIPGPNAVEMAAHVGFLRAGLAGTLVAGCAFTLPATLIAIACAWGYQRYGTLPAVEAPLAGSQGRRAGRDLRRRAAAGPQSDQELGAGRGGGRRRRGVAARVR